MKDKTLILLNKITKGFNIAVDFLMKETTILVKKLYINGNYIFKKVSNILLKIIHHIEHSDDWKFFEKNILEIEKSIFKYIPKPVLQITYYLLDSVLYFIKIIISIIIKILRALTLETYKQVKSLPHMHQRFLFLFIVVFITSMLIFRNGEPHFIKLKPTPVVEKIIQEKLESAELTKEKEEIKIEPKVVIEKKEITVKYGDTLAEILQSNDVDYSEINKVISSLKKCYDPRSLTPNKKINLLFEENKFIGIELGISLEETCSVIKLADNSFESKTTKKELFTKVVEKKGTITGSIFSSGKAENIPHSILVEFVKMYSWDVDFVRDIKRDDKFSVMYEVLTDEDGNFIKNGDIIYANMNLSGRSLPLYKYKGDFFKEDGRNIKKALLRTPINGARISSPFGMRKHPILGYSKMHTGIDFAASKGTPIYAAGDGKIAKRGWNGGYGNYIKIRHNSVMYTAYGHMSRFAKNLGVGSWVKQGQIIGYVGSTGRSTGAHLHYEIIKNKKKVNPMKVKLPNKKALSGNELTAFKKETFNIRTQQELIYLPSKKPKA